MTKRLSETTAQMDCAIGSRIRAMRILRGLSQTQLADVLGITFQQIQKYEKGTNRVAASTLVMISEALKVSPLEILGIETNGAGNSAFADLAQHCRHLEAQIAQICRHLEAQIVRTKRALAAGTEEVETPMFIGVEFDDGGRMQAYARASPPN